MACLVLALQLTYGAPPPAKPAPLASAEDELDLTGAAVASGLAPDLVRRAQVAAARGSAGAGPGAGGAAANPGASDHANQPAAAPAVSAPGLAAASSSSIATNWSVDVRWPHSVHEARTLPPEQQGLVHMLLCGWLGSAMVLGWRGRGPSTIAHPSCIFACFWLTSRCFFFCPSVPSCNGFPRWSCRVVPHRRISTCTSTCWARWHRPSRPPALLLQGRGRRRGRVGAARAMRRGRTRLRHRGPCRLELHQLSRAHPAPHLPPPAPLQAARRCCRCCRPRRWWHTRAEEQAISTPPILRC